MPDWLLQAVATGGPATALVPGAVVGEYTLRQVSPERQGGNIMWECVCSCGTEKRVRASHLRSGRVKSCGCHRRRNSKQMHRSHGQSKTPEWNTWVNMRQRCENPDNPAYDRYGGRGVTVSDDWQDYEKFAADMGPRPSPRHSLERVDNSLGYSRENCVWATHEEQSSNRRNTVKVLFGGKERPLSQVAREFGVSPKLAYERFRRGWSVDRILERNDERA